MIGVIGGYGEVGLQAARLLKEWGKFPLRIGGRNPEKARIRYEDEFHKAEWVMVDIENDKSLETFINGCELLVNCAGPSHRTTQRVAQICLSNGCHHIDAGIDKSLEMMHKTPQNTIVLYAAGATPGLAGLLPRWLANSFDTVNSLIAYTGALDRFTTSGAEDYLVGVLDETNEPLAAWQNGVRCSSALIRRSRVTLPFFPCEVAVYPYFDAEAEFVASELSLLNGEWYMAVDGDHLSAAIEGVRSQFHSDAAGAIKRLCLATELDTAGRQTYMIFLVQLDGVKNGISLTRTVILRTNGTSILTGSVAAVAGIAVLEGEIPVGVGPVAAIPDPDKVITRLRNSQIISQLKIFDSSIDELLQEVEGEI